MNSIAQQAVPKGIGQSEFPCAHVTSASSFVVRKSAPPVEGTPGASGGAGRAPGGTDGRWREGLSDIAGTSEACEKLHNRDSMSDGSGVQGRSAPDGTHEGLDPQHEL